ncbi:hypothetical protein [Thalassotalea crassostreae]|uniref:hypothetical protein n=1 Tax=Thalassotalea crassostreae TaxID=1763536 RepID=UPI00083870EF|nr:hypothetical protein [Thalassotalea crassostreae]
MTFIKELKRRNVVKVAIAYLITSWLILQILSVLTPYLKLPEVFGSMVTVILVIGFPIACLIAWAFELTPEGVKRSKDVVLDESITTITGRKLDLGIITALVITVVFLVYEAYFSASKVELTTTDNEEVEAAGVIKQSEKVSELPDTKNEVSTEFTSIAVLPFVNMSNDPEQEYFSDGLSEELLNVLARLKQLKVAARTSSFYFKNKNMDIKEIAEKLDVEHILEGSVRKSGTKLRVTAQLIKADNGYHLWSETYDYELDDIFKIQDEISAAVVQQLKLTLLDEEYSDLREHGTDDIKAQDAYLVGRYHIQARTPQSLAKAEAAFKKSIAIDPNNQLAISGLADTYSLQEAYADLSLKEYTTRVKLLLKPYFDKASNSAEMLTSIGSYYHHNTQYDKAREFYHKAIEKNPNYAQAYHWMGQTYVWSYIEGDKDFGGLAITNLEKALKLDPYSSIILSTLYNLELFEGKLLEAENYLNRMLEVNPNSSLNNANAVYYFWATGRDWYKAWQIMNSPTVEKTSFFLEGNFHFLLALDEYEAASNILHHLTESGYDTMSLALMKFALESYRLNRNIISQDEFIIELKTFMQNRDKEDAQWLLAQAYLIEGDNQGVVDLILNVYPDILIQDSYLNSDLLSAGHLCLALKRLGDPRYIPLEQKIKIRADKMLNNNLNYAQAGLMLPSVLMLSGNAEASLQALKNMYVDNEFYSEVAMLEQWDMFAELQQNPKFIEILAIAKQKLEAKVTSFKATIKQKYGDDELFYSVE